MALKRLNFLHLQMCWSFLMWHKILLAVVTGLLFLAPQQAQETESQLRIQKLINTLPAYSWLRIQLQSGMRGEGKSEPYMERMRQSGVRSEERRVGKECRSRWWR